ncbi:hypothetical protein MTsPCn5_25620 [Croceitalea sp. MTPC5]|uniref:BfmA/BtgA family mobilization protein n=1 Tax=Croceitalea sp. MTPC5 TaxID=3056565 RepID=UPI002B3C94DC|nr:hypothetical protein MTsPCn5_25620 [Croceitalea sp. MTPC5]
MEKFFTIRFHRNTAQRFKHFSKRISKSYTETLDVMIDFFEWHGYSPHQRFGKEIIEDQKKTRKRIDAVIAIIKSVEKSQNIPLINIETMLLSLFEGTYKKRKPRLVEKTIKKESPVKDDRVPQYKHNRLKRKYIETSERLLYVLDQVELVKNRFGKDYLRIDLTHEELARYKQSTNDAMNRET